MCMYWTRLALVRPGASLYSASRLKHQATGSQWCPNPDHYPDSKPVSWYLSHLCWAPSRAAEPQILTSFVWHSLVVLGGYTSLGSYLSSSCGLGMLRTVYETSHTAASNDVLNKSNSVYQILEVIKMVCLLKTESTGYIRHLHDTVWGLTQYLHV